MKMSLQKDHLLQGQGFDFIVNESPSKNPDIKTPLVAKNEKQLPAKSSPLAAF